MSLRQKFVLALLATSLAVVALSGWVAHTLLLQRFGQLELERSFQAFKRDVGAYVEAYGSWENAQRSENFGGFTRRFHADSRPSGVWGTGEQPPGPGEAPPQPIPPDEEPPPGTPSAEAPSGGSELGGGPPFRFLLYDPQGRVVMGDESYAVGQAVPPTLRASASPISVQGHVVVWAVPLSTPNLTARDRAYIATINQTLLYAAMVACILALLFGWICGDALSAELRKLTAALRAVSEGQLQHRVQVRSRDEVGCLAEAFNRMSEDLARTHAELQRSTEEVRAQAALLKEQSIRDPLTLVYNRRFFAEQAEQLYAQAVRYEHPLTVMIGDIDEFKRINDRFSHAVGDEVLRQIAQVLQSGTRASDVLARYGGEEFVIAFSETPLQSAAELCERLRARVEAHPWSVVHPDLRVTISMGLSDERTLGSVETMLAAADRRLYQAKASGRNRVAAQDSRTRPETHPSSAGS